MRIIIVFYFISDEREHEIGEGMIQDGILYCYITLEKSHKIVRLYNKGQLFSSLVIAGRTKV